MEEPVLPVVLEEDATLPGGVRLGKYQIVRLLGAGGMGAVYEAFHTEIGKRVAIKTLAPAVAAIPGARQRFLREAQLTSRLRHPHIVDLTDMGTEGRIAYLVMELLAGEDLAHRLERTGPMPVRDLVDLMLPVCAALVAAHEAGVVHRDLKPQNIFLATGHQGVAPKVLDFGISKSSDADAPSGLTSTGSVIGTPHYLAPEQIKDARSASAASDQYSLGVIFYRCLTNANPFEGDSIFGVLQAIVTEMPTPLRERRADLPESLERLVARAMNPDPKKRFPSVRALGAALLPFASAKARVIWEETFTTGLEPEATTVPELPRQSHTMPMPTPERPLRFAAALATAKPRVDSGTLSPAVTSHTGLGLEAPGGNRRGKLIAATLAGLALAVGAFAVVSRGSSPPEAPPSAASAAPVAAQAPPVPAMPSVVAVPSAVSVAEEEKTRVALAKAEQEKIAQTKAAAEKAEQEQAATKEAEAKEAEAKEAAKRAAEAKPAEGLTRRGSAASTSPHHGGARARPGTARPGGPAAPNQNPNGAPVID